MLRLSMILVVILLAAVVQPAGAQQSQASVTAPVRAPAGSALPGPRLTPQFQRYEARLDSTNVARNSAAAVASGQHTIVVSTLALVLGVIIVVLLVVN